MVTLHDIFDVGALNKAIDDGYVTDRPDASGQLGILNYTPKAQYDNHWTDVTKACRGLIYNRETLTVVARPFEKFFNWDQGAVKYPPPGPVLRMPKMDGAMLLREVRERYPDVAVTEDRHAAWFVEWGERKRRVAKTGRVGGAVALSAGALVTPWASLATLLWLQRCRSAGLRIPLLRLAGWGAVCATLTVATVIQRIRHVWRLSRATTTDSKEI